MHRFTPLPPTCSSYVLVVQRKVAMIRDCKDCGVRLTVENSYTSQKRVPYCKTCANTRKTTNLRLRRQQIIEHLGGKCVKCGYDKYVGALHVHHINPSLKDPNFRTVSNWSWKRILVELENCELLCANCHAEEHATR